MASSGLSSLRYAWPLRAAVTGCSGSWKSSFLILRHLPGGPARNIFDIACRRSPRVLSKSLARASQRPWACLPTARHKCHSCDQRRLTRTNLCKKTILSPSSSTLDAVVAHTRQDFLQLGQLVIMRCEQRAAIQARMNVDVLDHGARNCQAIIGAGASARFRPE